MQLHSFLWKICSSPPHNAAAPRLHRSFAKLLSTRAAAAWCSSIPFYGKFAALLPITPPLPDCTALLRSCFRRERLRRGAAPFLFMGKFAALLPITPPLHSGSRKPDAPRHPVYPWASPLEPWRQTPFRICCRSECSACLGFYLLSPCRFRRNSPEFSFPFSFFCRPVHGCRRCSGPAGGPSCAGTRFR